MKNTDGIGGIVRITGSDDDQSATRANCISGSGTDYRTFRGFRMDITTGEIISLTGSPTNIIIEDCYIVDPGDNNIEFNGNNQSDNTVRRCRIMSGGSSNIGIYFTAAADSSINSTVENCILEAGHGWGVASDDCDGITVKNCLFFGCNRGINIQTSSATTPMITVNNSLLAYCIFGLAGLVSGEIVEDFNSLWNNNTDRSNTATGANSQTYPAIFESPSFLDGFMLPWNPFALSEFSQVAAIAGSSEATDDFFGITRPTTSAKKSWGPIQRTDMERETGTVRTGTASIVLHDAGRHQIFVPVTNESTTFSVYVRREIDYDGTLPQMVIKQPGQADDTTTDVGATDTWNELTTTLTPASTTDFVIVELVSNNTASAALYAESVEVFFDDLTVS